MKQWQWIKPLLLPPYNIPMLAGFGFLGLGLLLVMMSVRSPWYQVPVGLKPAAVVDQSDLPPTRVVPDKLEATIATSKFEFPCKVAFVLVLCLAGFQIARTKLAAETRAHALGTVAASGLAIGLLFAHLVIVDDPKVSHLGAWMYMQHDSLSWYGGDTYTSREYEIQGGAWEVGIKDSPKFMAVITPPYLDLDIATLGDFLTWAGLCHAFWIFMGKGWANLMMGSLLVMLGSLCTRLPGQTRGLSSEIVVWVLIRATLIVVPWVVLVTGRSVYVASILENAQKQYELGNNAESLKIMRAYRKWMPCLEYDSGLMVQEGILEHSLNLTSDRARFAEGFLLESNGYADQAQKVYLELMSSELECVRREAARHVLRRAIIHFNSGSESIAKKLVDEFQSRYPCMVKGTYVRLLIAVRDDDFETAQHCIQQMYASVKPVGMPESRGYLTSCHQHLAQMAFDHDDLVETRRQVVYRMEKQP